MKYCQQCGVQLLGIKQNSKKRFCDDCIKLKKYEKLLEYNSKNPDKLKQFTANYIKKHKETINSKASERRKTDQDKEYQKNYALKNKETKKEYDRQRYLAKKCNKL